MRNAGLANPVAQSRQTGEQFRSAAPSDCRYRYICGENNQAQGNAGDAAQPIDNQTNLAPFEANQVQANPAPTNLADAAPIQIPDNPTQANDVQANTAPFEGNQETQDNTVQALPVDAIQIQLPAQENPVPTLPETPSTVLDILAPQPPVPVQIDPVLPQPDDVEIVTAPEAPQQVLGTQDFYSPSQDSLDAYKYYPYTTVLRT